MAEIILLAIGVTVAILAQGTSWAVAVTQAFLDLGSIPAAKQPVHPMGFFSSTIMG